MSEDAIITPQTGEGQKADLNTFLTEDSLHGQTKRWTEKEFAAFYSRHRGQLLAYAKRLAPSAQIAEEMMQEAILYLMTALPELDSEIGVLRYVKWKIKNLVTDHMRSPQSVEVTLGSDLDGAGVAAPIMASEVAHPSQDIEAAEDAAIVRLAFAKIPANYRRALFEDIFLEKSNASAAEALDMEAGAYRTLLHRSRKSFRKELELILSEREISVVEFLRGRKYLLAATTTLTVLGLVALFAPLGPINREFSSYASSVVAVEPTDRLIEPTPTNFDDEVPNVSLRESGIDGQSAIGSFDSKQRSQEVVQSQVAGFTEQKDVAESSEPERRAPDKALTELASSAAVNLLEAHFTDAYSFSKATVTKTETLFGLETFTTDLSLVDVGTLTLAFSVDPESGAPSITSVILRHSSDVGQVISLATGIHSKVEPATSGSGWIGEIVATGFVTADLSQALGEIVLEGGYLYQLALQVDWVFESLSGTMSTGFELVPRT